MAAVSTKAQTWLLAWSIFQIGVAILVLNSPSLLYGPLDLWARILPPVLLASGIPGALMRWRWMLYAGWAGVGLFLAVVFATAIPPEEFVSGGTNAPHLVSGEYALGKFFLLLSTGISLGVCLRLLAKRHDIPALGTK
jgi:hypothetical protein